MEKTYLARSENTRKTKTDRHGALHCKEGAQSRLRGRNHSKTFCDRAVAKKKEKMRLAKMDQKKEYRDHETDTMVLI